MELREIEQLLDKYFDAETTVAEEKALKEYFASANVAPHLEQYRPMFGYFASQQEQHFEKTLPLKKQYSPGKWLSVAASLVLMCGLLAWFLNTNPPATQHNQKEELGTYDDPEEAFRETQKALSLVSSKVNKGINSMGYLAEYEKTKEKVFKD
jgi:hypothetical protein